METLQGAASTHRYLNVAFVGEHASGKSTVAGHLMKLLSPSIRLKSTFGDDKVSQKFIYAALFDKLRTEREQGLTITFHEGYAQSDKTKFQFTDCPGYPKYFKNLIRGI